MTFGWFTNDVCISGLTSPAASYDELSEFPNCTPADNMAFLEKTKASCAALFHKRKGEKSTQPAPSTQTRANDSCPMNSSHPQQQDDDSDRDPYSALSEVSDREPIERTPSEGLPRRSSIEQRMTDMAHSPHTDDGDMFEALSEVSSPEPCERLCR